jgi:hypothetical protein
MSTKSASGAAIRPHHLSGRKFYSMAGVVTEYLYQLIGKQVEDHKLVVWYDPERAYAGAAAELELPDTAVARYDGSFLQLRRDIDHLLNGEEPPRLVVYVPEDPAGLHHALVELEAAGVVLQPGQQPPQRNTRLSIVARNALKTVLGEDTAYDVETQVEAGKLTLADVNALAQKGGEISSGVVSLIFGTGNPQEVCLVFLGSDKYDSEIEKKSAQGELVELLGTSFDIELSPQATLADVRDKLARHVLLTDLIHGLGASVPPSLASLPIATSPVGVDSCVRLAKTWRGQRDDRDSYVAAATKLEQDYHLGQQQFDAEQIGEVDTCLAIERALLRHVEQKLLRSVHADLLELAQSRLSRFWSAVMPTVQAHWALIASAAEVLLEADRVEKDLKKPPAGVPTLIKRYADGDAPWCLLDRHHRHMESRWYNFEPEGEQDGLDKLIVKARGRYVQVGSDMARHFVTQFAKAKHPLKGIQRQRDIYELHVKPLLGEQKIAYVWVDALRFEMARELCDSLGDAFSSQIAPVTATIPTITEIGMASLLPHADTAKVVSVGGGKLALDIGGTIIKERKDRVNFLKNQVGVSFFEAKLDDLLPKPSKKVERGITDAKVVLITSQEIDELCEKDNISQARRQMDGVLSDLGRGVRTLVKLGVQTVILCADHGHLFADEISDDMKIDAPGGETADLHRRVWVGVGGTTEPSYLRTALSSLGVDSEYDIATPYTFACFKSKGGARAYFHGGLSPQELIIPVVTLTPSKLAMAGPPKGIHWEIKAGTTKLTTRFFSVQIAGQESGGTLFGFEPPKVRLEIRAKGKCVSHSVSASYGFEDATGEVQLRVTDDDPKTIEPNTIAMMLVDEIAQKSVTVVLLDASSGAELASLDKIEVAISI